MTVNPVDYCRTIVCMYELQWITDYRVPAKGQKTDTPRFINSDFK